MDELATRLRDAGTDLLALREPLVAGEPWPLADEWGHTPEADWGPREVLAHVNEMLPYWTGQLEAVVAGDQTAPVPFGRVATDQSRMDRIEADRARPAGQLLDEISVGLDQVAAFIVALSPADAGRLGLHPSRGEITVEASIDPFLVGHLADHVVQLRSILERERPA